jgi:RNA polymerase sigma-70 factor (ECF subfamily)
MMRHSPADDRPPHGRLPEPREWLDLYGDVLYRYARARLRRPHEAEEAVQDALLAALRARDEFAGRSQPQSWLLGILRNKVLDRMRAASRAALPLDRDGLDACFGAGGKWRRPPARWEGPADAAERQDFWRVVHECLARLPAGMAEAFTLRTLDERSPEDVCRDLSISQANLWVLLHRARLGLMRCLRLRWFDDRD